MKILIFGSSGFIGKYLIRELERTDHTIFYEETKILNVLDSSFVLEQYFKDIKPDVVINLSAIIPYGDVESTDNEILMVNTIGKTKKKD